MPLLPTHLLRQYEYLAACERQAGGHIHVERGLPYIAITMSDGTEYSFQEHAALELLQNVPDNICADDFFGGNAHRTSNQEDKMKYSNTEIANSLELWNDCYNTSGLMTDEDFHNMAVEERLKMLDNDYPEN